VRETGRPIAQALGGLPAVVENVWLLATVQTCIILILNTFRLASRKDWDGLKPDIKPACTVVNAAAARTAMDQVAGSWGKKYPAVIWLRESAWSEFIPFLDNDLEIRKVLCSTDEIVKRLAACQPVFFAASGRRGLRRRARLARLQRGVVVCRCKPRPGTVVAAPRRRQGGELELAAIVGDQGRPGEGVVLVLGNQMPGQLGHLPRGGHHGDLEPAAPLDSPVERTQRPEGSAG